MLSNYSDENFDVKSLRIADLRRILLEHNVDYPSSAKKHVLLNLFYEHVFSRKKIAIEEKRHSRNTLNDKIERNSNIKQIKQKTGKKRTLEYSEESGDNVSTQKSGTRRLLRRSTSVQALEVEEKKSIEKGYSYDAFSDENIFQKGSPSSEMYTSTTLQRSMEDTPPSMTKLISNVSRKTIVPHIDSRVSLEPQIQIKPLSDTRKVIPKPQKFMAKIEDLTTSPQFYHMTMHANPNVHVYTTQTLQNENDMSNEISSHNNLRNNESALNTDYLEKALILDKEKHTLDPNKEKKMKTNKDSLYVYKKSEVRLKRSKKFLLIKFFIILIFGIFVFMLAAIWRQETIRLGYCDVEIGVVPNIYSSIRKRLPKILLENVLIYCRPCPSHAICHPNYKLVCEKDYIITPSIFSINGLIPISPLCAPDTEKLKKVNVIVNEMIQILRDRNAKLECGSLKLLKGEKEGILQEDLEKYFWEMKSVPNVDDQQFQELLSDALEDVTAYDEILLENDGHVDLIDQKNTLNHHLLQTSHLDVPLENISDKDWYVIESIDIYLGIIFSIFFLFKIKSAFSLHRAYKLRISGLVHFSFQRLLNQKRSYISDPKSTYPYVAISHLRDDILVNEFSADQRHKLWNKVKKIVESNSNVRTRLAEINGEWVRAWEWVGSTL
ncbi:hypothetical protein PCK1_002628 [Pneumocystis canis]|nr:hypothetical protein PCK1_002628 [Pneumocystis canis]